MVQRFNWSTLAFKSLVIMGLWTIVILLISSITLLSVIQEGMAMSIPVIIYYEFLCITPWIVLTPFIVWLARRYSFAEKITVKTIAVHLSAMLLVFIAHTLVQSYTVSVQYGMVIDLAYLQRDFLGFLDMRLMLYVGILLAVYGLDFHRKNREVKLREPRLRAELDRAKFQTLLNNIQPEFMLKTIDVINDKLDSSVDEAEELLTDFSDLLRLMLNSVNKEEMPVYEDIKAYNLYIRILQKRVGHSVKNKIEVDEQCYDAVVPSFLILIPILEDIIHHESKGEQAITCISYEAEKLGDRVKLQAVLEGRQLGGYHITDVANGMEMDEMIQRLQLKYGQAVDFRINSDEHRFAIRLVIPFRQAEPEDVLSRIYAYTNQDLL